MVGEPQDMADEPAHSLAKKGHQGQATEGGEAEPFEHPMIVVMVVCVDVVHSQG